MRRGARKDAAFSHTHWEGPRWAAAHARAPQRMSFATPQPARYLWLSFPRVATDQPRMAIAAIGAFRSPGR